MTPAERAMGRFMRAPDDHPTVAAPAAPSPAVVDVDTPAPAVPEPVDAKTVDDLYNEEFGGFVDPDKPVEANPSPEPEPPAEEEQEAAPPQESDEVAALRREAEEARAEADRLRREAEERRAAPKDKQEPQEPQEESPPAQRPNPDDYEFGEADSKFIEDLAEWKANETFTRRQQETAARQQEARLREEIAELDASWKEATSPPELLEEYPDFHAKVMEGAAKETWKCSIPMTIAIKSSPVGTHVAYELASNAAEAERIFNLPPMEQMLEIGRLEGKHLARVESKGAAPKPLGSTPVKPSKAPEPPATRSRGAGGQFASAQDAVYERFLKEM